MAVFEQKGGTVLPGDQEASAEDHTRSSGLQISWCGALPPVPTRAGQRAGAVR